MSLIIRNLILGNLQIWDFSHSDELGPVEISTPIESLRHTFFITCKIYLKFIPQVFLMSLIIRNLILGNLQIWDFSHSDKLSPVEISTPIHLTQIKVLKIFFFIFVLQAPKVNQDLQENVAKKEEKVIQVNQEHR